MYYIDVTREYSESPPDGGGGGDTRINPRYGTAKSFDVKFDLYTAYPATRRNPMNTIFLNRYAHVHAGAHAKRGCENLGARIIFDGGHNIYPVRNTYIYIYSCTQTSDGRPVWSFTTTYIIFMSIIARLYGKTFYVNRPPWYIACIFCIFPFIRSWRVTTWRRADVVCAGARRGK